MNDRVLALARLSDGEKLCLRRRLAGETAKQSALAMGVSPHAVEKHLKMARAKLGLSSSLAAARLLADVEAGRLVPQPAGLAVDAADGATGPGAHHPAPFGAFPMLLIALLTALPPSSAPRPASPAARPLPPVEQVTWRVASPAEIRVFVADAFATMDQDHSGYIERAEAPQGGVTTRRGRIGEPLGPRDGHMIAGRAGQAMWIGLADADADGRVSLSEWLAYDVPIIARLGRVPANWRGVAAARAAGVGD